MRGVTLVLVVIARACIAAQTQYIGAEQRTQIFSDFSRPRRAVRDRRQHPLPRHAEHRRVLLTNPEGDVLIDTGTSLMPAQLSSANLRLRAPAVRCALSTRRHFHAVQAGAIE